MLDSAFEPADFGNAGADRAPLLAFNGYELLEEIARGGMGVVYRARQVRLDRTVAIKMILGGHLAKDADLNRFRAEAETAAQLQHPNIVAIHEVGEHAGQPFFSMDLIEGKDLSQLVREGPLPARKAAAYLITTAQAVDYAHSRGVLHRDLKPSNILIDEADQPRITDFGLAKRLPTGGATPASTGTTAEIAAPNELTITGQVLGSPSFIPPEQAAGQKDVLGPASDVYSLGAILYHCLTGRPPFVAETLTQTLRMVAEQDPVSPRLLNAGVPQDLETICLKCLEKEPARRYPRARDLAEELGRFLRNEPIRARPVSLAGRVHRWCLRNKPLAVAGTVMMALLLMVAVGSPVAAWRINRERLQAEASQQKAQVLARFLSETLESAGPSVARGRDKALMLDILNQAARRAATELTNQPEVGADVRLIIGKTYEDLGEYTNALAVTEEALRLRRTVFGPKHPAVADALNNLGAILSDLGRLDEAEAYDREALSMRREIFGNGSLEVALSLNNLGLRLWNRSDYAGAEAMHREALQIRERELGHVHQEVAMSLNNLAMALWARGEFDAAEASFREALKVFQETLTANHPAVATMLNNLATVLRDLGQMEDAQRMAREALNLREKLLSARHALTAYSRANLAIVLQRQGFLDEAEQLQREALRVYYEVLGTNHQYVAESLMDLGTILARRGDFAGAEAMQRDALATAEIALGKENPGSADSLNRLGILVAIRGDLMEADRLLTNALAMSRKLSGVGHPDTISPLWHLAWVRNRQGDRAEAEALRRKATALTLTGGNYSSRAITEASYDVAELLQARGAFEDAEALFLEASAFLEDRREKNPVFHRSLAERMVRLYDAWHRAVPDPWKAQQADEWRKRLATL